MERESGITRRFIDQLRSWHIQRDQLQDGSSVTESIIDQLHSSDIMKGKVKVVLLEISLMSFILWISKRVQMERGSGVTGSIVDQLHSWEIHWDQMEGESGVT